MSKVNLKLKSWKGNYLPGSYDVGRLQEENFQEQLNIKLESSKFDNGKDRWNNFRKTICEVVDDVIRKKVKNTARNNSKKALCLIESRRSL